MLLIALLTSPFYHNDGARCFTHYAHTHAHVHAQTCPHPGYVADANMMQGMAFLCLPNDTQLAPPQAYRPHSSLRHVSPHPPTAAAPPTAALAMRPSPSPACVALIRSNPAPPCCPHICHSCCSPPSPSAHTPLPPRSFALRSPRGGAPAVGQNSALRLRPFGMLVFD